MSAASAAECKGDRHLDERLALVSILEDVQLTAVLWFRPMAAMFAAFSAKPLTSRRVCWHVLVFVAAYLKSSSRIQSPSRLTQSILAVAFENVPVRLFAQPSTAPAPAQSGMPPGLRSGAVPAQQLYEGPPPLSRAIERESFPAACCLTSAYPSWP